MNVVDIAPAELPELARAAAARLRQWLLDGPAQIRSGSESGAIAGTVNAEGEADYAYGEITGYYLHWLAEPAARGEPVDLRLGRNASSALDWCERRLLDPARTPTRIALRPAADDWRNQAVFCFDLAMLVGGLTAASRRGLIATPRALLERLLTSLNGFATESGLIPLRTLQANTVLPDRWSTRSGPFLVKAAARILSAQAIVPLPAELESACYAHLERFARHPPLALADPAHPTLYFLEGELALACEHNGRTAALLKALLASADSAGNLPESLTTPHVQRADIVAQALRIGVLLRAVADRRAPRQAALDQLAANLLARVHDDGAITFCEGVQPPQRNVWCAMFAEQALSWYARWRTDRRLAVNAWDLV